LRDLTGSPRPGDAFYGALTKSKHVVAHTHIAFVGQQALEKHSDPVADHRRPIHCPANAFTRLLILALLEGRAQFLRCPFGSAGKVIDET
jgi:hypothetical protein